MLFRKIIIAACLMSLCAATAHAQAPQGASSGNIGMGPIEDLKKSVVFLGRLGADGKPQVFATGFLVNVQNTYHLITAKHAVMNLATGKIQDENLLAFFNLKGGGVTVRSIADMKKEFGIDWIFHEDPKVDVAIIPFRIEPEKDDVKVVSDGLFTGIENLYEMYDVFFLSYQPGIDPKGKITPIVKGGMVSLINEDKTFYIDALAFPGNTGSPVFLKPSVMRFTKEGITIGNDPLGGKFIGIIGEYLTYQEVAVSAQTGRPRIVFEENTGLSRVWSVTYIQEIIGSEVFKKQLKKIAGK